MANPLIENFLLEQSREEEAIAGPWLRSFDVGMGHNQNSCRFPGLIEDCDHQKGQLASESGRLIGSLCKRCCCW